MWQMILGFIGGPIVNGLINAYKAKLDSANTAGAQAVEVAKTAMIAEVQARAEANKVIIAEQGRWYTALPRALCQYGAAAYFLKALVWDNLIMGGEGFTPPLGHGDVQAVFIMIMTLWFGQPVIKGTVASIRALWR